MAALITPLCVDIKSPKAFGPVATAPLKLASGQLSQNASQHLSSRGPILSSSQPDQLLRKTLLSLSLPARECRFSRLSSKRARLFCPITITASIICIQKWRGNFWALAECGVCFYGFPPQGNGRKCFSGCVDAATWYSKNRMWFPICARTAFSSRDKCNFLNS